jgi:hypothetical protein
MTVLAVQPELVDHRWARIGAHAPELAATCHHHLDQIAVSVRPGTVVSADTALRIFASWLIDHDPTARSLRQVNRRHIEAYKLWLASRENPRGQPLKKTTISLRLGMLRVIIERLIEWDHPDAPARNPIFGTDLPQARPTPPQVPRRRGRRRLHGRRHPPRSPPPARGRDARPHRPAGRRVLRPPSRRRGHHRRHPVATGPGRQVAHRPLHPATPHPPRAPHRLAVLGRTRRHRAAHHQPRPPPQPLQRGPHRRPLRPHRRSRPRPPPTSSATPWPPKPSTTA